MNTNLYILGMAILSLVIGLALYFWITTRENEEHFQATNLICWLLIALFPVLLIFSFFPESSLSGTIQGVSIGGAIGAFIFIWWYGTKRALAAVKLDELNTKVHKLESELQQSKSDQEKQRPERVPIVFHECKIYRYKLKAAGRKRIALIAGEIQGVTVADIWASSENTNMQMARYYDRSISGTIRYLGAKRDVAGNVTEDTIANELGQIMDKNLSVQPGTVLVTGAGELSRNHKVKKIFHVASVQGQVGSGYRPIDNIGSCVTNALKRADSADLKPLGLRSILFPLFGSGTANGPLKEFAERLLQAAITYMETAKASAIDCVYFLTWTDVELETCRGILDKADELVSLRKA